MNYKEYMALSTEEKFEQFMDTRFATNRTPSYWVDWSKVEENLDKYEMQLNTMNYLIGKDDVREATRILFEKDPSLISTIPVLLGCRDGKIDVLTYTENKLLDSYELNFEKMDNSIEEYIDFMDESGLLEFFKNKATNSLVDYVFGVEVGLNSNGRKNRSGQQNELILENNLKLVVEHNPYCEYSTQATGSYIKKRWGVDVPEALDSKKNGGRRYDGALYNSKTGKVVIIETNFYGGGGSKLKAVAGEFSEMYGQYLKGADNVDFVWISDGPGWDTARNPMSEAFQVIPNIINLSMVNDGYVSAIVNS